jgi:hypothetical protein
MSFTANQRLEGGAVRENMVANSVDIPANIRRGGSQAGLHLKLRFVTDKPPPSHVFEQVALMAAEENVDYF